METENQKLEFNDFAVLFGPWADLFRPFIESKEMYDIYQVLKEKSAKKITICPDSDNVFKSFQKTNPNDIRSIWYLMDPYPRRYSNKAKQATGIPMDCSNTPDGKLQPSLDIFYDGITKDLKKPVQHSKSLEYLLEQGVLLLNTDLTVELNKTASHEGLWEPFQKFFLEEVMRKYTGIVYVLSGKSSNRMEQFINPLGNHIFKIEHPAAAAHKHTDWDHKGIFNKTNKLLKGNKVNEIFWSKGEWDAINEDLPF